MTREEIEKAATSFGERQWLERTDYAEVASDGFLAGAEFVQSQMLKDPDVVTVVAYDCGNAEGRREVLESIKERIDQLKEGGAK